MYNSIIEFIEKDTTKIEKFIKESLLSGNMMRFEEELLDTVLEFGRSLYQEILESIEQTIRNSEFRKQSYHVEHKEDRRTLLTRFGNIEVKRAYYAPKHGGKRIYLLDKYVGMDSNDKVSQAALAQALREVKKLIHGLEVEMPEDIPEKKKRIKKLHIQADEDHVALQFYEKKGDLQISENGRKSNTVMPKLILLYEDIEEEGKPGSKRYRLTGKHYFGGVYEGAEANEDLWLEVQQYIYDNYDTEYLENVYIAGDGAPWIVSGCQVLEKSKFVLDKFHLWKYISAATSHLLDSTEDARELIYAAIREKDQEEVQRLLRKCGASALTPGKQKEIEACRKYIQNNWLGIIVRYNDAGADWGCSAEGQISHVLSARESSRPMGWSKTGVHKMTQLRVYTRNGGNVIDLLEYQHKKEQMQKRIKKQDELVREGKRNHRISGEETLRKEIPGLERASMTWMRDMIYGYGA